MNNTPLMEKRERLKKSHDGNITNRGTNFKQ